jgi:hypothetical protein
MSFHLIVDGCNGPIRFREQELALSMKSSLGTDKILRNTSISILNCFTQQSLTKRQKPKNASIRKKNQNKERDHVVSVIGAATYQRLDVLPLMELILQNKDSPLEEITIVFDGVSITKCPSWQSKQSQNETNIPHVNTLQSSRREYNVSDRICVEITGIYEEGDNVIVEKVECWQQQRQDQQQLRQLEVTEVAKDRDHTLSNSLEEKLHISSRRQHDDPSTTGNIEKVCIDKNVAELSNGSPVIITVVNRSDQGPGKARTILQPLGLLRPESVLCLFKSGFGSKALESEAICTLSKLRYHSRIGKTVIASINEVMLGGQKSLHGPPSLVRSVIVVTDDIFLRQRVVNRYGFVMSFQQLWILLAETRSLQ